MDTRAYQPKTVYATYIVTTPDQLWSALTNSEITRQYFFGLRIESDWKVGSAVNFIRPDGVLHIQGEVLECEPLRRLSITWVVVSDEDFRNLPASIVTYQLDPLGDVVRLTMSESHQEPIDGRMLEGGRRGWPVILSNLKTLLETGRPMPAFDMSYQHQAAQEMQKLVREAKRKA